MILGKVIGRVVLSEQEEKLTGLKLIIFQPVDEEENPIGEPQISVDTVGAGKGELVLICEGDESMLSFPDPIPPADAGIVGVVDRIYVPKKKSREKR